MTLAVNYRLLVPKKNTAASNMIVHSKPGSRFKNILDSNVDLDRDIISRSRSWTKNSNGETTPCSYWNKRQNSGISKRYLSGMQDRPGPSKLTGLLVLPHLLVPMRPIDLRSPAIFINFYFRLKKFG
jgi:hypothetical protein